MITYIILCLISRKKLNAKLALLDRKNEYLYKCIDESIRELNKKLSNEDFDYMHNKSFEDYCVNVMHVNLKEQ